MIRLPCSDGTSLHVSRWMPARDSAEGVLLIVHGMGEYGERYAPFADFMAERGFYVYAPDLRGHGQSASMNQQPAGHFADKHGWQTVLEDLHALVQYIRAEHGSLPFFLFGHSMGSLLVRAYTQAYPSACQGVIHSAVSAPMGLIAKLGYLAALVETRLISPRGYSSRMSALLTGKFNHRIASPRTPYDWLSRDDAEVDKYIADSRIIKQFTAAFYRDMIGGAIALNNSHRMKQHPTALPMLFIAGEADPLGNYGKGAKQTQALYQRFGCSNIELQLYPEARHELFQEHNRAEVMSAVWQWMQKHLSAVETDRFGNQDQA